MHTLERGDMEKHRLVVIGERLKLSSFDDDLDCDSESMLPSSPEMKIIIIINDQIRRRSIEREKRIRTLGGG